MIDEGIVLSNDFHLRANHRAADFASGYIAAWSFVTVGQPLDYLKLQYQVNSQTPPLSQMYQQIGLRGFYKGASSIYLMIGTITAIEFFCFELFCDLFSAYGWVEPSGQRNTQNLVASGFLTGAVAALIYTPIEFSKIQCQVATASKQGSVSLIWHILTREKLRGVRKLYTGLTVTMAKETFGSALYFGGYHLAMSKLLGYERNNAPIWAQIGVGIASGVLYQLFSFPFDAIKSNLQSGRNTLRRMLEERFWRTPNFRRGFAVSLTRSMITDPTNFLVYENCRQFLQSRIPH